MKNLIKLHETLYQCGCTECYPGITSATPVAWVCEDTYAVILRQDGGFCVKDMPSEELSSFENCTQEQIKREKHRERCLLIDEIVGAHPERFAGLLLDAPEALHIIRPILDQAQKTIEETERGENLPLCRFCVEAD